MSSSGKILSLSFRKGLSWFYESVKCEIFCTYDSRKKFELVKDKNFCLGYTYKCNKCKSLCTYSREDYIKDANIWIPVHIICLNCGNTYRSLTYIPTYHRIFLDWDLTKRSEWIWRFGDGHVIRNM